MVIMVKWLLPVTFFHKKKKTTTTKKPLTKQKLDKGSVQRAHLCFDCMALK